MHKSSHHFRRNLLLLGALVSLVTAMISASLSIERGQNDRDAVKFERVLHKKEQWLNDEFKKLASEFQSENPMDVLDRRSSGYQDLSNSQGISVFYFYIPISFLKVRLILGFICFFVFAI